MVSEEEIQDLATEFAACQGTLVALGDESRQQVMLTMMRMGNRGGARVGEVARLSNLSRPTVSHHLQILRRAGIVRVRHEGTRNYYYFDADAEVMSRLLGLLVHARAIMQALPDRSGEAPELGA